MVNVNCHIENQSMRVFFIMLVALNFLKRIHCGCWTLKQDIIFLLEETNLDSGQFNKVLDFAINVVSINLTISRTETRVGAITFGQEPSPLFGLLDHTTHRDFQKALLRTTFTADNSTTSNLTNALRYVKNTFLSKAFGERQLYPNFVVLITSNTEIDAVQVAKQLRSDNLTSILTIGVEGAEPTDLLAISGNARNSFNAGTYDTLDKTLAETVRKRMNYCYYSCGNSYFTHTLPATLSSTKTDSESGKIYILTDFAFTFTCCGVVATWEFVPIQSGTIGFTVWRPLNGISFKLIGSNTVAVKASDVGRVMKHSVPSKERIAVIEGDVIGWVSSGTNILPYTDCFQSDDVTCPLSNLVLDIPGRLVEDFEIDRSTMTSLPERSYAVKAITAANSELVFSKNTYHLTIPDHLLANYTVTSIELEGVDFKEKVTYNISSNPSAEFFRVDFEKQVIELSRDLDRDQNEYWFVLTVEDSCRHTATATFSISTVNWPPIIQNLPRTVTLEESTKGVKEVFEFKVEDSGNDAICCSIFYTSPLTTNFQLRQNDTGVMIMTTPWAAFNYEKINSYLIYVCCEDDTASAKSLLKVNIKNKAPPKSYRHPVWLYVAVAVSSVHIVIILMLSCAVIFSVMFQVEDPIPRRTRTVIRIRRFVGTYPPRKTSIPPSSQSDIIYDYIKFDQHKRTEEYESACAYMYLHEDGLRNERLF